MCKRKSNINEATSTSKVVCRRSNRAAQLEAVQGIESSPNTQANHSGSTRAISSISDSAAPSPTSSKEFFDLPRELRDTIYDYVVASTREHKSAVKYLDSDKQTDSEQKQCTDCSKKVIKIYRPKQPYFTKDKTSCRVPDLWLSDHSRVSKQWATETRAAFFRHWIVHLDAAVGPAHDYKLQGESIPFIFGPEAKYLRRLALTITFTHGWVRLCDGVCMATASRDRETGSFELADAKLTLQQLQSLLHPRASIYLQTRYSLVAGYSVYGAHATVSEQDGNALVVKKVPFDELAKHECRDYTEHCFSRK